MEFYRNGELFDVAYEEPYYTLHQTTWIQGGITLSGQREEWRAAVSLHSGDVVERTVAIG